MRQRVVAKAPFAAQALGQVTEVAAGRGVVGSSNQSKGTCVAAVDDTGYVCCSPVRHRKRDFRRVPVARFHARGARTCARPGR